MSGNIELTFELPATGPAPRSGGADAAFMRLLIHECDVLRRSGQVDRFGQPVEPTADAEPTASYVCRLTTARGSERFQDRARDIVGETYTLFLPLEADVIEADRVTVRNRTGGVLLELGNVTYVKTPDDASGPHHKEASVSAERASTSAIPA